MAEVSAASLPCATIKTELHQVCNKEDNCRALPCQHPLPMKCPHAQPGTIDSHVCWLQANSMPMYSAVYAAMLTHPCISSTSQQSPYSAAQLCADDLTAAAITTMASVSLQNRQHRSKLQLELKISWHLQSLPCQLTQHKRSHEEHHRQQCIACKLGPLKEAAQLGAGPASAPLGFRSCLGGGVSCQLGVLGQDS